MGNIKYNLWVFKRWLYQKYWKTIHFWMYYKPERYIPRDTEYCYGITSIEPETGKIHCDYCPFHKHLGMDLCMLDSNDCCGDSCKTCGINCPDEEKYII